MDKRIRVINAGMRLVIVFLSVSTLSGALTGCSKVTSEAPILSEPPALVSKETITPLDSQAIPSRGFFMGILPIPREGQSFADAYQSASSYADFTPVWGRPTPFYNMAQELSGSWGQAFIEQYTRGNGMFPLVHMSFIGEGMTLVVPPGMSEATLEIPRWRDAYKEAAFDIVRVSRPLYLSLGNEVNRWYEQYGTTDNDPNGFQHYVSLYNEMYDAIKGISPQTIVFCTFAREVTSENREADLKVLSMFDSSKMDILVFTSYPNAVQGIRRPADIPNDYYFRALEYMPSKPFGFSEVGWSALDAFGGEQSQADFIDQVVGRLTIGQGVNLQLLGWPWLSALDENDSISFIKKDGSPRLAYRIWQELYSSGK